VASEITLKVGDTFLKITPGGIFCSPLNVGQGSAGSGRGLALQLPEGVVPLPVVEFPAHSYCPLLAQQDVSPVIQPAKKE
jgi:type VI secretion system secreted protein VgrG